MHTVTRLIDYFVPDTYELSLDLNRKDRTFTGTSTIKGTLLEGRNEIKLHAKDLAIETILIDGQMATWTFGDNDELSLTKNNLSEGEHLVTVRFSGTITDAMHGLYPCYYEHAGVKKELLATQFESHHAREVFPCIDEPAAKATFDLTLTTEDSVTVLGNMPVAYQDSDGKRMTTKFETSPRMSTYLLAFVTGELQSKTATTRDGVEVNVWATPAQPENSLDFALDIAVRTIEFYNDYFGTPYPLPKSDHVALPDFGSGAMENWGLITYREVALLAEPNATSIASKHYIATVIAHELAHQWFGNLVTMEWWNDLWLNESFATLMEYVAVDALHPEWNIWLDYSASESTIALRRDALDGVQAVQVDVHHPDEISTLFDSAIVYAKGARLLRMIQEYIGSDAFQAGLKSYFQNHAYKNTVGNDLWSALAEASDKPVASIMNTWISQSGFPLVKVSREADDITLTQEQFFVGPHEDSSKLWPIPLNGNLDELPGLFETKEQRVAISGVVQLNRGNTAHFITQYDSTSLSALIARVSDASLDTLTRAQLLDEAILLARGGYQTSSSLIPLMQAYKNESSEHVWGILSLTISELRKFVEDNEVADRKLRSVAASLARAEYTRLGWQPVEGEPEEDTKLRSIIIGLTLYGEDQEAIDTAKTLYQSYDLEDLDPELRPLIISAAVRHGDASVVDELLELYQSTSSSELQQDICAGITSTRVPEKIELLLATITNQKIVRAQDVTRWFVYLIRGRDSKTKAWEWVRDNWDWIIEIFGGDKNYDNFPRYAASALTTKSQLDEYVTFFEPKKEVPALTRVIALGIAEIEGRVALIERDKQAVQATLLEQ